MVFTVTNSLVFVSLIFLPFLGFSQTDNAKKDQAGRSEVKNSIRPAKRFLHHRFDLGFFAGGERIQLEASDGRKEETFLQYTGPTVGYEYLTKSDIFQFGFGIHAIYLQGQAKTLGTSITYEDNVNSTVAGLLDGGFILKPHPRVYVGLSLGALYRNFKLEVPKSVVATYGFDYQQSIKALTRLKLGWFLSDSIYLEQSLLVMQSHTDSPNWTVSIGYSL